MHKRKLTKRTIKLLVISLFAIPVFLLTLDFSPSSKTSGQNGSGSLASPTGISASNGDYINKVGINWDTIRGATTYRIFRNTTDDSGSATDVGTTQANSFFDSSAPINQNLFYWVRAENDSETSDFSDSAQGLRRTGNVNGPRPPLEPPTSPVGNDVTATKTYLGKVLFWEEQLSSTRTVSCGTCHINSKGGSDPNTVVSDLASTNPGPDGVFGNEDDIAASPGVPSNLVDGTYQWNASFGLNKQVTGRKANSTINSAYPELLFWDGRASNVFRDPITNEIVLNDGAALESQAAGPPTSDVEMAHSSRNWTQTAAQIENSKPLALVPAMPIALETWINDRTYPELFEEAFGTTDVTPSRIAMAIATYERTLFSDRTPIDRLFGGENTLTAAETRGRNVFNNANCLRCHGGTLFSNDFFLYIGVRPTTDDLGRFEESGQNNERGAFRAPSLRNVELRAPYMHNGRFETLEDVVAFYNRGGDFDAPNKAPQIVPQGLNETQLADLVTFLKRPLTDARVAGETGPFDRPTLYTESNRVPTISGVGRAGTGGNTPQVMAIEPPLVGNPSFTVAVSNAATNETAVLVIDSSDPGVGTTIPASGSFARESIATSDNGTGIGFGSVSIAIPDDANLLGETFFGRWYVNDSNAPNGFSVSQVFQFTVFGETDNTAPTNTAKFDFDGDNKTDIGIYRPSNGQWWLLHSSTDENKAYAFGNSTDKIVPADYTGDGKTDVAFYRNGEWFILRSEDFSFYSFPFGNSTDIPAPGDFDNDGIDDAAVFRPSTGTWFIQASTEGTIIRNFGLTGDVPQVGDFDGDGKDDLAIFRPSGTSGAEWWIDGSTVGTLAYQFGVSDDQPVAADYTGDAKTDVAIYRDGVWFVLRSENSSFYSAPFGTATDQPAPGDFDGDGMADFAVFRESQSTWYLNGSTSGVVIRNFGTIGDQAVQTAYLP